MIYFQLEPELHTLVKFNFTYRTSLCRKWIWKAIYSIMWQPFCSGNRVQPCDVYSFRISLKQKAWVQSGIWHSILKIPMEFMQLFIKSPPACMSSGLLLSAVKHSKQWYRVIRGKWSLSSGSYSQKLPWFIKPVKNLYFTGQPGLHHLKTV